MQYLGFPIINDPLYNQPTVWGKNNGKNGEYELTKEEIEQNFLKVHTYEAWIIKQEQLDNEAFENDQNTDKTDLNEENCKNEDENLNLKRKHEEDLLDEENLKKSKLEVEESLTKEESPETTQVSEILEEVDPNLVGFDEKLLTKDGECFECKQIYRDPKRPEMTMYLHALSYKVC